MSHGITGYAYDNEKPPTPDELNTWERNISLTTITYRHCGNHADAIESAKRIIVHGGVQSETRIRVRTITTKQTQVTIE